MSKASTLREGLSKGKIMFVTFSKKDGTTRRMICTTNRSLIPQFQHPRTGMQYESSQIRVWDVVAQEWRSMTDANISEVEEYKALVA